MALPISIPGVYRLPSAVEAQLAAYCKSSGENPCDVLTFLDPIAVDDLLNAPAPSPHPQAAGARGALSLRLSGSPEPPPRPGTVDA